MEFVNQNSEKNALEDAIHTYKIPTDKKHYSWFIMKISFTPPCRGKDRGQGSAPLIRFYLVRNYTMTLSYAIHASLESGGRFWGLRLIQLGYILRIEMECGAVTTYTNRKRKICLIMLPKYFIIILAIFQLIENKYSVN